MRVRSSQKSRGANKNAEVWVELCKWHRVHVQAKPPGGRGERETLDMYLYQTQAQPFVTLTKASHTHNARHSDQVSKRTLPLSSAVSISSVVSSSTAAMTSANANNLAKVLTDTNALCQPPRHRRARVQWLWVPACQRHSGSLPAEAARPRRNATRTQHTHKAVLCLILSKEKRSNEE
jgi:hypothetical protein